MATRRHYWFFGARLSVLADAADTGGRCDLIEGRFPAGAATPLHRHNRYLEQIYVLEGECTVWAGDETFVLRAGDTLTVPPGMTHAVAATGGALAHALTVAVPSGFARLVTAVGAPDEGGEATGTLPAAEPNMALFARLAVELGDEVLGPVQR